MLFEREAKGSVNDVCEKLAEATTTNGFGVLGVHDLKQKMAAKGVALGPECRILEVCNPHQAKTVLEADMTISAALPCRISVYEQGGKVRVCTIKPTAMLALYESAELDAVARDVEATIIRIIDAGCA